MPQPGQYSGHPHYVAGRHRQLEVLIDPADASIQCLPDSPDGLAPTEVLLDTHTVFGSARPHNAYPGHGLLHGEETVVFADAGYQGATKRVEATGVDWHVAMRPGKRRALDKQTALGALLDKAEKLKASVRAKVEHPFRVIKCQFGFTKVRYRGLAKNTAQLITLFALSNLWMARRRILQGALG